MDCKKAQSLVTAYVKRQLDDEETEEFIDHITHCQECHEELEIYFTIHFALQKLDEEQDVSYNIKQMLEDDLEATERKVRGRRIFRICSYGVMLLAEILLVISLITQGEFLAKGDMKKTFAYQMLYGQDSPETDGTETPTPPESETANERKLPETPRRQDKSDQAERNTHSTVETDGENNARKNSID